MNPFERFLALKPVIEADAGLMAVLNLYARSDPHRLIRSGGLPYLGRGTTNVHFRIGEVDGIHLAVREYANCIGYRESQEHCCESYIAQAVEEHDRGTRVPQVTGGVCTIYRRFLIVEDLTCGGTARFTPARDGELMGILEGAPVAYDFPEIGIMQTPLPTLYMQKQHVIELG